MRFCLSPAGVNLLFLVTLSLSSLFLSDARAAGAYLLLSGSPTRSGPVPLNNAVVKGDIYVFAGADRPVQRVEFFVDNPRADGTPDNSERVEPYDLAGTNRDRTARPYDSTRLGDGVHTLTAIIVMEDGSKQKVSATFTVANHKTSSAGTSVQLSWAAPATRSDGEPLALSEIAGYVVHYGNSPGAYPNLIRVDDAYTTSLTVTDLPAGTYYFALTAQDTLGAQSAYSDPAKRIVP